MFTRILMILTLVGGLYYLYWAHHRPAPPPPPPPPPAIMKPPTPAFAPGEIEKIRSSAHDTDPSVRWNAIELLYKLHDTQSLPLLQNTLVMDSEPTLRRNALELIALEPDKIAVPNMLRALKDSEPGIRSEALINLAHAGDSALSPRVAELLGDPEPSVRLEAINALKAFQEKKRVQYQALADELNKEYQAAVAKSQSERH